MIRYFNLTFVFSSTVLMIAASGVMAEMPSLKVQRQAWQELQKLDIRGVELDQRFNIKGETFYVSPEGDDAANGSLAHPWKTLEKACMEMAPGRVIYLKAGTYYGPVDIENVEATADACAALRAAPGEDVIVRYSEDWIARELATVDFVQPDGARRVYRADGEEAHYAPLIRVKSSSYVEVSALHLIGARKKLPHHHYSESGVQLRRATQCRILYNEIENVGHCAVKGGDDLMVDGNWLHDVGVEAHDHAGYFGGVNIVFRRNLVVNVTGWGVHGYKRPDKLQVTHNIFMYNKRHGILLGGPNGLVAHNVFANNAWGGVFLFRKGARINRVVNNLFLGPAPAISLDNKGGMPEATPQGNVFDFNFVAAGVKMTGKPLLINNTVGVCNVQAGAVGFDLATLDFRPQPGNPVIGAGMALDENGEPVNAGLYSYD